MNFCQIPHFALHTQLKPFLASSSSLHIPNSNELHCSLIEIGVKSNYSIFHSTVSIVCLAELLLRLNKNNVTHFWTHCL